MKQTKRLCPDCHMLPTWIDPKDPNHIICSRCDLESLLKPEDPSPAATNYTLHLGVANIPVFDSADAASLFCNWRDRFGLGASDLERNDGKVTDAKGKLVCTICYNGRVKLPNGQFVDGMSGQDWMTLCSTN